MIVDLEGHEQRETYWEQLCPHSDPTAPRTAPAGVPGGGSSGGRSCRSALWGKQILTSQGNISLRFMCFLPRGLFLTPYQVPDLSTQLKFAICLTTTWITPSPCNLWSSCQWGREMPTFSKESQTGVVSSGGYRTPNISVCKVTAFLKGNFLFSNFTEQNHLQNLYQKLLNVV